MKEQDILTTLQKIGLTYYGAKAYYTLIENGMSNPKTIAEKSGIPRTKIYDVLNKLEKDKWITIEKTRPANVKARYPREVIEERKVMFNSKLDEICNELTVIHDNIAENEIPLIKIIQSPEKIIQITEKLIKNSKNKIILIGSLYLNYGAGLLKKELSKAKHRGVNVRLISDKVHNNIINTADYLGEVADIKMGHPYFMKTMVIDNKENLFMMAHIENGVPKIDSVTVIWITSPFLASYISSLFEREWERLDYFNKETTKS